MPFRRRAAVVGVLAVIGIAAYGTARYFSPALVIYVVDQSLIQKAPPGVEPDQISLRLHALLESCPDKRAKLAKALSISQDVEKVQVLTPQELDRLLSLTPNS